MVARFVQNCHVPKEKKKTTFCTGKGMVRSEKKKKRKKKQISYYLGEIYSNVVITSQKIKLERMCHWCTHICITYTAPPLVFCLFVNSKRKTVGKHDNKE